MAANIPRLDWLLRSSGLIRSAKMYSAFIIDGNLHFVETGPGWQRLHGAYQAYNFLAKPIMERHAAKSMQALQAMERWNLAADVPKRSTFTYPLDSLTLARMVEPPSGTFAPVTFKARTGRPRTLRLEAQDQLASAEARRRFFAHIPGSETRR